jgi:cytochrome c oxidase subunit III
METGTIKTIVEKKREPKRRTSLSSGFGSNGGRNRGGGGGGGGNNDDGGGNLPGKDFAEERETSPVNKFRITMAFLLLVVLMTFGGLIGAYIVISTNGVLEWKPQDLPKPLWVSTVLILASSLTYKISLSYLKVDNQRKAKNWLLATTILGAAFISSQILAWLSLVRQGVYVRSNPYVGFFYILTAVHAVHVVGGIAALGYIVLRTWNATDSESELKQRKIISGSIGWYWHFMDALWIVLVLLLGFWK